MCFRATVCDFVLATVLVCRGRTHGRKPHPHRPRRTHNKQHMPHTTAVHCIRPQRRHGDVLRPGNGRRWVLTQALYSRGNKQCTAGVKKHFKHRTAGAAAHLQVQLPTHTDSHTRLHTHTINTGNFPLLGVVLQRAVLICLLVTAPITLLLWGHIEGVITALGQPPAIASGAARCVCVVCAARTCVCQVPPSRCCCGATWWA